MGSIPTHACENKDRGRVRITDKESKRQHYERNRDRYIAQAAAKKLEIRAMVQALKDVPCADCKKRYPFYVMQFDHVRGTKLGNIATLVEQGNVTKILAEIDKCEVVCANCHAARTWSRMQEVVVFNG